MSKDQYFGNKPQIKTETDNTTVVGMSFDEALFIAEYSKSRETKNVPSSLRHAYEAMQQGSNAKRGIFLD